MSLILYDEFQSMSKKNYKSNDDDDDWGKIVKMEKNQSSLVFRARDNNNVKNNDNDDDVVVRMFDRSDFFKKERDPNKLVEKTKLQKLITPNLNRKVKKYRISSFFFKKKFYFLDQSIIKCTEKKKLYSISRALVRF